MPAQVRRVFRQNGEYVCGMCRRRSVEQPVIAACFEQCVQGLLAGPVVSDVDGDDAHHRCGICSRRYQASKEASECAKHCAADLRRYLRIVKSASPPRSARSRVIAFSAQQIRPIAPASKDHDPLPSHVAASSEASEQQVTTLQLGAPRQAEDDKKDQLDDFDDELQLGVAVNKAI